MNGRVTCVGVPARRRGTRVICYFRRRVCTWTGTERIGSADNVTGARSGTAHWPLRPFASLRIMSELFLVFYDRVPPAPPGLLGCWAGL